MKLPVDRKRTLIMFAIADLAFAALLFLSCFNIFLFQKWGALQFVLIGIFVFISILMLVLSLTRNYYVIERQYLVVVRATKEVHYFYNNVVYIDKTQTEKKRVLSFCTDKGVTRYLPFDKKGKIYNTFLLKCKNLLSEEEFKAKYPNVKL